MESGCKNKSWIKLFVTRFNVTLENLKFSQETSQQENKHQTVKRMSNQTWSEINILRIKAKS